MINDAALGLDLIGAESLFGEETIDHRVCESGSMAAGLPDFGVHDDRGFEADDIIAALRHGAPPEILDVAFKLRAERAVIPEPVDAAVDFGGLEDKAPAFAQGDNPFHQIIGLGFNHTGAVF